MGSIEPSVQSVKAPDPSALTAWLNLSDFVVTAVERDVNRKCLWHLD
mgnify:CR=1 FL=1